MTANVIHLQATRKPARIAAKITIKANDFVFRTVKDFHFEASHASATISGAAVIILDCVEHFVSLVVLDRVFIVRFESDEC